MSKRHIEEPRVRRIKGTPYWISDKGILSRDLADGRIKVINCSHKDRHGYLVAHLRWTRHSGPRKRMLKNKYARSPALLRLRDGRPPKNHSRYVGIHILVLEAFVGARPPNQVAKWRDGNKLNCEARNLTWGAQESQPPRGIDSPKAKLTEAQVLEVRERAARGEKVEHFAHEYKMTPGGLRSVVNGSKWKHLPGALKRKSGPDPLPPELRAPRKSRAKPKELHRKPGPKPKKKPKKKRLRA